MSYNDIKEKLLNNINSNIKIDVQDIPVYTKLDEVIGACKYNSIGTIVITRLIIAYNNNIDNTKPNPKAKNELLRRIKIINAVIDIQKQVKEEQSTVFNCSMCNS